jgi:hypothetical protein
MKNSVIYIVGATVLVGGAYLFLKNKKAKDLSKLAELGGTTSGGTSGGTSTGGTTTSDGVNPSDANLNLANATVLVGQRAILQSKINQTCVRKPYSYGMGVQFDFDYTKCLGVQKVSKEKLIELDKKLATLGYKVDSTGSLVKI